VTTPVLELQPRRLVLAAAELELLRRLAGDLRLPADFSVGRQVDPPPAQPAPADPASPPGRSGPASPASPAGPGGGVGGIGVESAALAAAARSLADQGVLQSDPDSPLGGRPHPSVAANLQVFASAEVLLETRVQVDTQVVRAAHAVAGGLGASLARIGDTATVELSVFPAERLGLELVRVVPATGAASRANQRPAGLVPLDAVAQVGLADEIGGDAVVRELASELRLTAAEQELARALSAQATGVLHCLVSAPPRRPGEPGRVGQVLWYGTPGGWVGLDPEPTVDGRRAVRLRAAAPIDLGAWVAPLVAGALR
jgi:hypothetical protein